jgi:2-dehydropantolactone reductase
MSVPNLVLNTGAQIPAISFGSAFDAVPTFSGPLSTASGEDLVSYALKTGYYHIDTAESYETEDVVGEAIKQSGIPREKLFITTKISSKMADPARNLEQSLKNLQLEYVDLYLIHSPSLVKNGDIKEIWRKMEELQKSGKTRAIGVSNFSPEDLEPLLEIAEIKPANNQIEYSPYLRDKKPGTVEFCQKHNILLTAYAPLSPFLPENKNAPLLPVLEELAKKYNRSPAQINLNWVYNKGLIPIIISTKPHHIEDAIGSFDFELDKEDVERITAVGDTHKFIKW